MDPGGNGKQIFGDCWWLDTEGQAPVQSALSDQNLQAYLASSAKPATPKGGPLSHLQAPKFINSALNVFKDRQQAPDVSIRYMTSQHSHGYVCTGDHAHKREPFMLQNIGEVLSSIHWGLLRWYHARPSSGLLCLST